MSPDDPRHGTNAGAVQHTLEGSPLCDPCHQARFRYRKELDLRRLQGPVTMPAQPVRSHIAALVNAGMQRKHIADAAGVHMSRVAYAFQADWLHIEAATAILAVRPQPGVNFWPLWGAVRRLRALIALGYTQRDLADRIGIGNSHMSELVNQTSREWRHLSKQTWGRIAEVYDELHMTPGTSEQSRRRAARNGWAPPLAWNNIDARWAKPRGTAAVSPIRPRKPDRECAECPRCGVRRQVRVTAKAALCSDCKNTERRAS